MYDQGHTNPLALDISPTESASPRGGRTPIGMRSPGGRSPGVQLGRARPAISQQDKADEAATILMWSLNAWNKQKSDPTKGARKKLRRLRTVQVRCSASVYVSSDVYGDGLIDYMVITGFI